MPKKKKRTRATRRTTKGPWKTLDHVWAEKGVVRIRDARGTVTSLSIQDAASRANSLNEMLGNPNMPESQRNEYLEKVERIVEVIKEACTQRETPADKDTEILSNVQKGLTAEGKAPPQSNPDDRLAQLCFRYPALTMDEVRAICQEHSLPMEDRHGMMRTINSDRLLAIAEKQNTDVVQVEDAD